MAGNIRGLFRSNVGYLNNVFVRNNMIHGTTIRYLYTERALGVTGYTSARMHFNRQFQNVENAFRNKMMDVCEDEKSMVFTEDLKSMAHLVQKRDEDVQLLTKMLQKYSVQNSELRFGNYVFGPVVMRALYFLDEPNTAYNIFKDPKLENIFDQRSTHHILMSLLFKHQMFNEMKDVFEEIKKRCIGGQYYPDRTIQLLMAGLYSENTQESLDYALTLWRESHNKGFPSLRRTTLMLTHLALLQNKPEIAFEILSTIQKDNVDSRSLKVLTYMKMNRYFEINAMLHSSLEYGQANKTELYLADAINVLEDAIKKENVYVESDNMLRCIQDLRQLNCIKNGTIREFLLSPLQDKRMNTTNQQRPWMPRRNNSNNVRRSEESLTDFL